VKPQQPTRADDQQGASTTIGPGSQARGRPLPFETLRFDAAATGALPEAPGFERLDRHLARWQRSNAWLGLPPNRDAVVAALRSAVDGFTGAHRLRVTLTESGEILVTSTPLPMKRFNDTPAAALAAAEELLAGGGRLPRVALALQRVDESDPARAHKTTSRDLYYAGRRFAEDAGLEDVLFLDSRGMLCEGSIASVFVVSGRRPLSSVITPPLSTGALPGVLREELIDLGLVLERDVDEAELRAASAVLIGSSVRGLRRVELAAEPVDVG